MDYKNIVGCKQFKTENIIYIPMYKRKNNKKYANSYAIEYKDIKNSHNNLENINNEIWRRALEKVKNDKNSLVWDIFLDKRFTDIQVIDIDNYEETLVIFDEICKYNDEFKEKYKILKETIFNKTFTVKTKSGGRHYYIKRILDDSINKKVKCIKLHNYLDNDTIQSNSIFNKLKKGKIDVDYLCNGTIKSPWHRSYVCDKERSYTIIKDCEILLIDDEQFNLLCYFFKFLNKTEDNKKMRNKGKSKDKSLKKNKDISEPEDIVYIKKLVKLEDLIFSLPKLMEDNSFKLTSPNLDLRISTAIEILDNNIAILKELDLDTELLKKGKKELILEFNYTQTKKHLEYLQNDPNLNEEIRKEKINITLQDNLVDKIKDMLYNCFISYFYVNPEIEIIGNNINKIYISNTYKTYNTNYISKALIDNVKKAVVGKRSEIEMAFILNLKLRNFTDTFIYYYIHKYFPNTSKSIENPNFIENCLIASNEIKNGTREYTNDNIWDRILKSYLKIQRLNINYGYYRVQIEPFRYFLELLYNNASISNSFDIHFSPAKYMLLGHKKISRNTIMKYLQIAVEMKLIKIKKYEKYEDKKFPSVIELKDLSKRKRGLIKTPSVNLPTDGYQDLFLQPGINPRSQKIIHLLRENGTMSRAEIHDYFLDLNDHKNKINKCLRALLDKNIIITEDWKIFHLTEKTFKEINDDLKREIKEQINEIENSSEDIDYRELRILNKRLKKTIKNKPNQILDQINYANLKSRGLRK